jgi:hypothetical protein
VPEDKVGLDDDVIPFKYDIHIKQYMKDKSIKWVYRLFKVCHGDTANVSSLGVHTERKRRKHSQVYHILFFANS